jgi:hypothetical protein
MKTLLIALLAIAAAFGQNMDCSITVPANPLSATGLSTPYLLFPTVAANGPCNMATDGQTAFVEAVIWDSVNNQMLAYHPLVVDMGTTALVAPVVPTFPQGSTVAIWFGFNGNNLILADNGAGSFQAGSCVNGALINGAISIFGQFAYCNALAFFPLVQAAAAARAINPPPPPLGVGIDGFPCPTTRDFAMVDMDPVDNVVTTYIINTDTGKVAQNNTQNLITVPLAANVKFFINPSDSRLITSIDAALGCTPYRIRNLDDPQNTAGIATLATNEIHAGLFQVPPIALIALSDPMANYLGGPSLVKVNAYRRGIGQPIALTNKDADQVDFCKNLYAIQPKRLLLNFNTFINAPTPSPAAATNLYYFLAQRLQSAFGINNLNCEGLLGVRNPVNVTRNADGVAIGAQIAPPNGGGGTPGIPTSAPIIVTTSAGYVNVISLVLLALVAFLF